MSIVTVIDYGASNLLNVVRALEHCGAQVDVTNQAATIAKADKLILPGVGAFGDCAQALSALDLDSAITDYIRSERLFLGICVGMQILFEQSEEFGTHKGLGVIPGNIVKIPTNDSGGKPHKVPHIGWNTLRHTPAAPTWNQTILEPLEAEKGSASTYFVHSYMGVPNDPAHLLADVDYNGISICAAVRKGNAYGFQFHPEKSGEAGLSILRNFLKMA